MDDPPPNVWVRVSGRRDELLVSGIDYATDLAAVGQAADGETPLGNSPLHRLLALREIEAAQAHRSSIDAVRGTLRSSERCYYRSRGSIWHLRELLRTTFACIHRSQVLISESDQLIARLRTLDCNYGLNTGCDDGA